MRLGSGQSNPPFAGCFVAIEREKEPARQGFAVRPVVVAEKRVKRSVPRHRCYQLHQEVPSHFVEIEPLALARRGSLRQAEQAVEVEPESGLVAGLLQWVLGQLAVQRSQEYPIATVIHH